MSTELNSSGRSLNPSSGGAFPESSDRRQKRRVKVSAPVRVRAVERPREGDAADAVTTTINISRMGILICAQGDQRFSRGMDVAVTLPYSPTAGVLQAEQPGRVIWVTPNPNGTKNVAIALGMAPADLQEGYSHTSVPEDDEQLSRSKTRMLPGTVGPQKPLILLMERHAETRENIAEYLGNEGYHVVTVTTNEEARKLLDEVTPALVIAEIEGEGVPGYELCAHCKSMPRLKTIPVMLLTNSGLPSDYSGAHAVGAVACMVKPFKQERLGHVVRMLAPPPHIDNNAAPPHRADPARRTFVPKRKTDVPSSLLRKLGVRRG